MYFRIKTVPWASARSCTNAIITHLSFMIEFLQTSSQIVMTYLEMSRFLSSHKMAITAIRYIWSEMLSDVSSLKLRRELLVRIPFRRRNLHRLGKNHLAWIVLPYDRPNPSVAVSKAKIICEGIIRYRSEFTFSLSRTWIKASLSWETLPVATYNGGNTRLVLVVELGFMPMAVCYSNPARFQLQAPPSVIGVRTAAWPSSDHI